MASEVADWRNDRYLDDETGDDGRPQTDSNRDERSRSQQDRDRILYTSALRRLATVTQVVSPTSSGSTHNRLTHAIKVAQVGRRIAENLLRKHPVLSPEDAQDPSLAVDPEVVETAGLAHDLGHPPFGHAAEEKLDELAKLHGCEEGFEGNAQSFRIVACLEVRGVSLSPGLGLTRATLNALLKYPWGWPDRPVGGKKFGAFREEKGIFDWCRGNLTSKTLEAQIMDWADDITYAAHDLEDFYRSNAIPVVQLHDGEHEVENVVNKMIVSGKTTEDRRQEYSQLLSGLVGLMPPGPYRASLAQRRNIRAFISFLIGTWINATGFDGARLYREPKAEIEVALVKELTWQYVITGSMLIAVQEYQKGLVQAVFELLQYARSDDANGAIIPPNFRELINEAPDEAGKTRVVTDVLATMSEDQVQKVYRSASEVDWTLA